jgi:predicted O-linked N-acetylglucosamine transferase (SPINDLY family)
MGVPVVSLIGPSMHQRLALSLLTNAGLGDLCAYTPEDYVKTAIALANDRDRLRALRTGLRQSLQTTPLCDAPRYVRALEDRLLEIADRHGLR